MMNNKKEETSGNVKYVILKDATKTLINGNLGYRIKAVRDIPRHGVNAGDLGGFVEHEDNLSQRGDCWIADDAEVSDEARVFQDAIVMGTSCVNGIDAMVCGEARVEGKNEVITDILDEAEATICKVESAITEAVSDAFGNEVAGLIETKILSGMSKDIAFMRGQLADEEDDA